ncbi:dolichol phosphate-mannose biosynthesis regulatory protein [Tribonema minus]|uniref:Dolichol phosphate-mannose biosynthesis regulatory protein n=1 Tax=Tribonema minus TaxID=303371 RepID=A0A835ZDZ3_9STRA|nr:dolichol phosphate-mannose biosynthesis regulatory protein [Tribonema minus]
MADKALGLAMVSASVVIFTYYTLWVIVLHFVDPSLQVHEFFPDRVWAIAIPAVLLVLGVAFVVAFIAVTMIRSSASKKKQS